MQQTLITTHKENIEFLAARFPQDVELYSEMLPLEQGLQRTIDKVSRPGLQIWVRNPAGQILAQSTPVGSPSIPVEKVISLSDMPIKPQVYQIDGWFVVLSGDVLNLRGQNLGRVYMAQDVTQDQQQLNTIVQRLAIASVLIIVLMMTAIALRIRSALRPLEQMSQLASTISVDDLSVTTLEIRQAPREVKGLVQAFNEMLMRLSNAWEEQRQFVSNVSHELRTPLTVVLCYLQSLLRRSGNLSDYQQEALETASAEMDRTVRLLQNLLDLARAESGYAHFQKETVNLNHLLVEVAGMAEKFSQREVRLTTTAPDITAAVDRDRLRQVLVNLIDNAMKYSEPDQTVDLKLEQKEQQVMIQVQDYGCGIDLQHQSRIFERFYRSDEHRARTTGGYGLGLAIVKTLVEGMGGQISLRSKPNEGTVFTIILPS